MKLKLGAMSNSELAEWFGLTSGSFRNKKKEKLRKLEDYCDFEEMPNRRGVIINTIYIEEYSKDLSFDKLYHQYVIEQDNHLTSASGMARKLIGNDLKFKDADEESLAKRFRKAGVRTYGKVNLPNQITLNSFGYCGSRKYVWAIKVDDFNNYRFKTKEEEEIYKEILEEYAGSETARKELEYSAMLFKALEVGEIDLDEAMKRNKSYKSFFHGVIKPFKNRIGEQLVMATEHDIYSSMVKQGMDFDW